ncbi:hypothetical protein LTR86_004727 [Recurvomyces mirabilis]|nr:hypothetical protein LTR86_004727 [Recurvomyces mirabilis]
MSDLPSQGGKSIGRSAAKEIKKGERKEWVRADAERTTGYRSRDTAAVDSAAPVGGVTTKINLNSIRKRESASGKPNPEGIFGPPDSPVASKEDRESR